MGWQQLITRFDSLLCRYLGLDERASRPNQVKLIDGDIVIRSTEAHSRHTHTHSLQDVLDTELSTSDRDKLGLAIGHVLADNLVVTFDAEESDD